MFGLKRVKAENEVLKQELADLKQKYQTDVTALEKQLQETQQLVRTAQQEHHNSDAYRYSNILYSIGQVQLVKFSHLRIPIVTYGVS